jgi:autotransporter translocation and assembly factor TamB
MLDSVELAASTLQAGADGHFARRAIMCHAMEREPQMNKSITLTFPHTLPKHEARQRVEQAFGQLGQQLTQVKLVGFERAWVGDRVNFAATFLGQQVRGHVDVLDQTVGLEVELPGLLAMLVDVVRGRLQAEGRKLLAKNAGR